MTQQLYTERALVMKIARALLHELGLPEGDRHDLPTSTASFPDGAHYRVEIPSVEGPAAFRAVERAVQLGVRSVLIADEGLLWLINHARQRDMLPRDLVVKASALLGAANPLGTKLLVDNGLNTINVASDISLARLAALRQVISIAIDLYIESPDGLGGFTRYHEIAEIVRVAAPIYLKFGLRNAPNIYPSGVHLEQVAVQTGRERVRRALLGLEMLARSSQDFRTSQPGAPGLGVPVPP